MSGVTVYEESKAPLLMQQHDRDNDNTWFDKHHVKAFVCLKKEEHPMTKTNLKTSRYITPPCIYITCILCFFSSACSYLDTDVLLSDQEFEESFGEGGMTISGTGRSWRCGTGRYHLNEKERHEPVVLGETQITGELGQAELDSSNVLLDNQNSAILWKDEEESEEEEETPLYSHSIIQRIAQENEQKNQSFWLMLP